MAFWEDILPAVDCNDMTLNEVPCDRNLLGDQMFQIRCGPNDTNPALYCKVAIRVGARGVIELKYV